MLETVANGCDLYSRKMLGLKARVGTSGSNVDDAYWLLLEATQRHGHPDYLTSLYKDDAKSEF